MKRFFSIVTVILLSLTFATAVTAGKAKKEVKISKKVLTDKIRGAWAGQVIGCTYGGPTEFKYPTIINPEIDIPWNEHIIKWWYDNVPGLYDDVYMDLTFVEVFDKEGLDAPVQSFAKAFAEAGYPLWHANLQARYNIRDGLEPPLTGYWENNPHADDIDFQIEADYAGIMSPGMPNTAAHYTDEIGHIMNYGDGWYGGVYIAAMYSLAFVNDDVEYIVKEALNTIPEKSRYYKAMADVYRWYKKYPNNWEFTWTLVNKKYGFDVGCPDGVYNHFNIDAVLNSAYVVMGLLYGRKNFYRTIDIATRCGADSDCNPASAAGILGTILGFEAIPEYWKKPVYEVEDMNFKYTDISLNKTYKMSYNHALKVIALNGGTVNEDEVVVKLQKPAPVRFEQSFEGHWPVEVRNIRQYIGRLNDIGFEGNGIVVKYSFVRARNYKHPGYIAEVEAYVDGKISKTVKLPIDGNGVAKEIFYKYNLPVGPHSISFKWLNKENGVDIIINSAIIYSDKLKHTEHEDK
jgi:hypothetical protein